MYSIPTEFIDFIDLNCNRKEFIQSFLQKNGIDSPIISINGKNHIYVNFSKKQYNPRYKIKTVIAHYDRAPFSYGANDNSVAVFCLMNWAVELSKSNIAHNVRLKRKWNQKPRFVRFGKVIQKIKNHKGRYICF